MIKIGIDTFGCDHGRSGLGSCLFYLAANLPENNSDFTFEFFGSEIDRFTYTGNKDFKYNSVQINDSLKAERSWHIGGGLKLFELTNNYDLLVYPAVEKVFPSRFLKNGIAIVNSVLSKSLKNETVLYRMRLKRGLSKIKQIIAATDYIKKDLISFGIPEEKITVIHNGIDHKLFYPQLDIDDDVVQVSPFSIKRPYFIYGSRLGDKNKKHLELIKAFELFKKNTNLPHRLILAGEEGENSEAIHDAVFNSEFASDILITGFFPQESFPTLYGGAEACIFPAVEEGVGLPILESMACGIPVLCSDSGALKEIGGNAPLYFNPDNAEEIAASMQRIIEDKELRVKMVDLGLYQASKYNWEDTVKKMLEVFKTVTEKSK